MITDRFIVPGNRFQLSINTDLGTWNLSSRDQQLELEDACIECEWHSAGEVHTSRPLKDPISTERLTSEELDLPVTNAIRLCSDGPEGVMFITEFVLEDNASFCLTRLGVKNLSPRSIHLGRVNFLSAADASSRLKNITQSGVRLFRNAKKDQLRFFGHGWQSWSYAGVLNAEQSFPRSKLGPLSAPMQLCWGQPHPDRRGAFISDFYGALVDTESKEGLLLGFLSQKNAFGRVAVELDRGGALCALWQDMESVRIPAGRSVESDWACLYVLDLDWADAFHRYMELVADVHDVGQVKNPISGWCSWNYYGQDITSKTLYQDFNWVRENLERVPLKLFQIDDGYQKNIGDWEQNYERLNEPLEKISSDIHAVSLDAGIWMAPLIALGNSVVSEQHPDWLLRDSRAKPVSAGFGWGRFFHALDGSHPGFRNAMRAWVDRAVSEWGFEYLKLDFLYAGALQGKRYDDTKTGAMVLRDVLAEIRSTVGEDTFLVGCGCPIGSGIGLVDSMRISPDVSEHWRGRYKGISLLVDRDPGFPSAWNAIRNTYYRAHQHGHWWLNDPDCLILRSEGSSLSENEVRSLVTMTALAGGVIVDSDKVSTLTDDRVAMLARLIPPINARPIQPNFFYPEMPAILTHRLTGVVGEWSLTAIFNFKDSAKHFSIESELCGLQAGEKIYAFEFWDRELRQFEGRSWDIGLIPAHGVKLFAFRVAHEDPLWIGDTIHISQGGCITQWDQKGKRLSAVIESGRVGKEKIWLKIPGTIQSITIDGELIEKLSYQDGVSVFEIQLNRSNKFELEWY